MKSSVSIDGDMLRDRIAFQLMLLLEWQCDYYYYYLKYKNINS